MEPPSCTADITISPKTTNSEDKTMRQIFIRTKAGRHRSEPWAPLLYAFTLACGTASAQQAVPESPALPPLPPPIYHPSDLPPLPLPTEQQLKRGRELLDKIVYVIANVPLTDAAAVLKVFGFTELSIKEYPTHADVGPKGKTSQFARIEELAGTGLSYIRVQPWVNDPRIAVTSWLSGTVVPNEACISIDEVSRVLGPITLGMHSGRTVVTDPVQRPKPLHGAGSLSFLSPKNPLSKDASVTFGFEYQSCATNFGFTYRNTDMGANK